VRHGKHRRVFAGAVVVEACGAIAGLTHDPGTALRRWIVGSAGKVAFLHPDVAQHSFDDRNVLRLAAVRSARHRELLFTPLERIKPAGAEERNYLKGFGAGAPEGEGLPIAGGAEKLVAVSDYRGVYSMFRFRLFAASDDYIQLERPH
jgi:hypothetical protein